MHICTYGYQATICPDYMTDGHRHAKNPALKQDFLHVGCLSVTEPTVSQHQRATCLKQEQLTSDRPPRVMPPLPDACCGVSRR